jgi:hypothetical protein
MSNVDNDKEKDQVEGEESSEPTVSGKGWDILVGGKDNLAAKGGSDPFDLSEAAVSSTPTPATKKSSSTASKAQPTEAPPRDLSPEELGYQPEFPAEDTPAAEPSDTPVPAGSMPGLSAGVTVTPVTSSTTEAASAGASSAAPSIIEVAPAGQSPATPAIIEVPASTETTVGGPVALPADQQPTDILTSPVTTAGSAPVSPAVPPWTVPQSIPIDDPFDKEDQPYTKTDTDGPELPPDEALAKALITQERIDALWDEINETYDLVVNDVRGYYGATQQAIDSLKKARELLLSGVENFDNAEKLVMEVKSRLRLEEKVRQWSATRGAWLAAYLILWLLLLSIGSLMTTRVLAFATQFVSEWMADTWLPGLFGGLGGIIGALWVLNKHITTKRDFDPIHTTWYVTNPILGIALGVGTYIIVRGGGWILTSVAASGDFNMTLPVQLTLMALCLIVGFKQNVLWALIDRFVKAVIPSQEEQAVTEDTTSSSSETSAG